MSFFQSLNVGEQPRPTDILIVINSLRNLTQFGLYLARHRYQALGLTVLLTLPSVKQKYQGLTLDP